MSNDPKDQSDEACVFGIVSPQALPLNSLEQYLAEVVAKRVYDAIERTWFCADVSGTEASVSQPAIRFCPEVADGAVTAGSLVGLASEMSTGPVSCSHLDEGQRRPNLTCYFFTGS